MVLYPWEFKTVFNNQLHILINLGKYVIARPNHLWGYKNQLWSLTFSTLDYKQFTSRASNGSRLSAFVQISALFTDLHYRHEQTSAPFDKVSIWSKERAERTVPSLGGHCKQANSAIFCSPLWPQTFMQTLRILCRYCADFCTKKCSLEALFWSLGSKAEAPTCGCFEGTSTSFRVPGDAKMVLEWAIKLKNRVINQGRMFSTDIQPCGSSWIVK